MTVSQYKYWAFLSFSRQDNGSPRVDAQAVSCRCWGDWLLDAVKTFSIPAEFIGQINGRGEIIPERMDAIFRPEPDDAAGLSAESRTALEQSICLIVICSPRSAQSRQVNEAVLYFKQLGRGKHILPIVVAGEPNASNGHRPDLSPAEECFVPALRHPVRPDGTLDTSRRAARFIFVDARHGAEKREILPNDNRQAEADLEMAKIQLIALLLGVGFNGLWWREQKRHFFDFTEAQRQAREALAQVEEVRRQLQEAQRQVREAQSRALETQNLSPDIQGQIQVAHHQAAEAQAQARAAQIQLQEFQNKVRDTQTQLEEARQRVLVAESKVVEAQQRTREYQNQLEEAGNQVRAAQSVSNQPIETRPQAGEAPRRSQETFSPGRNPRGLTKVLALLAVLALLTMTIAVSLAWRQRKVASQALDQAVAEASGNFALLSVGFNKEQIVHALQKIGGAEQAENRRRSLVQLAASLPASEIPEALKAAFVLADDPQRAQFQGLLLIRLARTNPESAMSCASTIQGELAIDQGMVDATSYFQLLVLDSWMQTDLTGAFRWVCQLPDNVVRQQALEKILPAVVADDAHGVNEGQTAPDGRVYQLLFQPAAAAVNWLESQCLPPQ